MASLREIREALFLSHASGFIDDIEFLLLHEEYTSDNLDFPYGDYPRVVYNGHKRVHSLKFQSVVVPNGLIAHLYGPVGESLLTVPN